MTEAAIFLPFFMLLLFGLIWAIQSSVQSERVQIAVRYSGLVSTETAPYDGYSIYALYNDAVNPSISTACTAPTSDALTDTGAFPGPAQPNFWSPISSSVTPSCTHGAAIMSGGGLLTASVFTHTSSNISANVSVPGPIQAAVGGVGAQTQLSASQNFLDTPDLGTLMTCYAQ
ncbi:MAG TPA: hypothetical protein VGY57_15425, partial [Vicinamibacterales bacterium]|nr:hypothetical protein [Vicinamibacterales bacterium]